jgi:parallel beta-helix repeat protein
MATAATAASGIALADDSAGTSSSAGASTDSGSSKSAPHVGKIDGDDGAATRNPSREKTTDDAEGSEPSEPTSDTGSPATTSGGTATTEQPTESAADAERRHPKKRSVDGDSRKASTAAPVADPPAALRGVENNRKTTTLGVRTPKMAPKADPPAIESTAPSADPPAASSAVAADPVTVDADPPAAPTPAAVPIADTPTQASAAPTEPAPPVAPTALLAGLQMTAAAKPVEETMQDPVAAQAVTVSEIVPATETDVASSTATLAAADAATDVLPPTKEDAGLSGPFLTPDASTGRTFNIQNYGATSNNAANDDAQVINAVINAAQPGDTVYMPNGTYHIKSTINLKTGVSLVGQSRDNTVLAIVSPGTAQGAAAVYAAPGVNNLTVSNFTITLASGRPPLAGVRLGNPGGAPVSRIAVKNLFIEKFERFGVELENTNNVLVDGTIVKNATALDGTGQGYGILISGYDAYNNWISNNTVGPVIRHAILIQGAHNNLVENNRITGTVSGAIDLHGEDEYANEIRYNVISDGVRNGTTVSPNGAGIEVGEYSGVIGTTTMHDNSGPGNYIHHNTVYNYSYGFRITNNSNYTFVEDNVFYDNDEVGILANLAPLNNLYISRNEVYGNAHGILLYAVTQAVVTDNIVHDNTGVGIGVDPQTTPYIITGNTVTNNGTNVYLGNPYGVYVPGPTPVGVLV